MSDCFLSTACLLRIIRLRVGTNFSRVHFDCHAINDINYKNVFIFAVDTLNLLGLRCLALCVITMIGALFFMNKVIFNFRIYWLLNGAIS